MNNELATFADYKGKIRSAITREDKKIETSI